MEKPNDSLIQPLLYANKKQWNKFLSYFFLGTGIIFLAAGIIFFFAYNWSYLPKFTKFGILETLLIITVSLVIFTSWNKRIKQIILSGAVLLVGTLLAVFGQVYQTGADSYVLFLIWSIFTLLWALAARFAPLWLIFIGLLCTTLWLYSTEFESYYLEYITILNYITWLLAISTAIAEYMYVNRKIAQYNYWFILTTSTIAILLTSCLLIYGIYEYSISIEITLPTTLILFIAGITFGWKQKRLFHIATIPFASLIILVLLIARVSNLSTFTFFLLTILTIVGTIGIIRFTLYLKEQWYDTEK